MMSLETAEQLVAGFTLCRTEEVEAAEDGGRRWRPLRGWGDRYRQG